MLRHIIYLSLLFSCACSVVHKFSAKTYRLEGEAAASRHESLWNRRLEQWKTFGSGTGLSPSLALNRTWDTLFVYVANVTIGTPAVTYVAEIDLFYGSDLCVIGPNANLSTVNSDLPKKHIYNPSKSTSYSDAKGNFSDYVCGDGRNGSDKITVDGSSSTVAMGIVDSLGYYLRQTPVDVVLGLNPTTPMTNADNLANQLLGKLDTPIMSWWQNTSSYYGGVAQLTVGGEDTDNCQANYVYAPQERDGYFGYGQYSVHINSAKIEGTDYEVSLNASTSYWPDQSLIYCNLDFFYVLTNASNAAYNSSMDYWECDCDTSKVKNIVLDIGDANDSKKLVLIAGDYIAYHYYWQKCFVFARGYEWLNRVELSHQFANNHCVAYNAKERTVGFADSKLKTNSPSY